MQTERTINTDVPTFLSLLINFGFVEKTARLPKHAAYAEYARVAADPVVSKVREKLRAEGKLEVRSGLFSGVAETAQVLATFSDEQLLRIRARRILNDFRLGPEDKQPKEQ